MATYPQAQSGEFNPALYTVVAAIASSLGLPFEAADLGAANSTAKTGLHTASSANKGTGVQVVFTADEHAASSLGFDWFDTFHVVQRSFDFGNLLSTQSVPIEVFNGFRHRPAEWSSFVNGAGNGTELGGLPLLPTDISALHGLIMSVDVSTSGDPFVDDTLDFGFSGVGTIFVGIVIQRIVMFGPAPEHGFREELSFMTKIYESKDGTEKRESIRKEPRRTWDYKYLLEEGEELQFLENILFDFHAIQFGVPIRFDETTLTADVTAGDTVISVAATGHRHFFDGGLVAIYVDHNTFDVLPIAAGGVTGTTLTLTAPTVNGYTSGVSVYPLSSCYIPKRVVGERFAVNLRGYSIKFTPSDNNVEIADLSAFSSFDGKLLLDVGNSMRGRTVRDSLQMKIDIIDGGTGQRFQDSSWSRNRRGQVFTMRASGRQAIWEMRQMLYAIRGRLTSFHVPRDASDLLPVADLLSGGNTIDVTNVGYSQFVRQRSARSTIRVNFVDGSTGVIKRVIDSVAVSPTVDRLTVSTNWPSTVTLVEISRIDYVEEMRFDTDKIVLKFDPSGHTARFTAPLKTLL